ncbi:MAG: hypothetical protein NW218_11535 [Saprospiraceae bacterium]|nr:hypothetical protein [Saprospiraceae bacterium]
MSPQEYVDFVRSTPNGFKAKADLPMLEMEVFYQPPTYVSLMNLDDSNMDTSGWTENYSNLEHFYQFRWSLKPKDEQQKIEDLISKHQSNADSTPNNIKPVLSALQERFRLITDTDTLPCIFYLLEANGQLDNACHATVIFESPSIIPERQFNRGLTFIFDDRDLFHKKFEFNFDKNKLNQQPIIHF